MKQAVLLAVLALLVVAACAKPDPVEFRQSAVDEVAEMSFAETAERQSLFCAEVGRRADMSLSIEEEVGGWRFLLVGGSGNTHYEHTWQVAGLLMIRAECADNETTERFGQIGVGLIEAQYEPRQ